MSRQKRQALVSWIGANDLKAVDGEPSAVPGKSPGPILSTLQANVQAKGKIYDTVELLYSYSSEKVEPYLQWLGQQVDDPITPHRVELSSPVHFGEIYQAANEHLFRLQNSGYEISILLSPGTPAMQAVWILLGKTRFPCLFYQSSIEQGVQQIEIPFELAAEYLPTVDTKSSGLPDISDLEPPVDAAFDDIITRNPRMQALKSQAQVLAQRNVPVLIYGETGTGKELFARAIHNASKRKNKPFIALNCGAVPTELIDSVLFGHKKGAFTGAIADKSGIFQQAHEGTLFLDEFGELEPSVQVRLLRVLQEGVIIPVGGSREIKVDVRIVAATHRNLMLAVADGEFREDLFYRVAVGVLHLPPLREREGDLLLLIKSLLESMEDNDPKGEHKKTSADAKNIMLQHPWRGNVRELQSTLLRASLWSKGPTIGVEAVRQALFHMPEDEADLLHQDVSQGIDIQDIIGNIASRYIREALVHTGHHKTRAAELLGLKNYQTLNNWMEKYGIE